eukprot:284819144_2
MAVYLPPSAPILPLGQSFCDYFFSGAVQGYNGETESLNCFCRFVLFILINLRLHKICSRLREPPLCRRPVNISVPSQICRQSKLSHPAVAATMAIGKNKRISKGKKGGKKKVGDPFLKKEWYDLKAPQFFAVRNIGKTLVSKSQGTSKFVCALCLYHAELAIDGLKGRVFETNLADLTNDEDHGYRKIRLCAEDIQGRNILTDFCGKLQRKHHVVCRIVLIHLPGADVTRHHLCGLIRKWHSLIETHVDVKTADGYTLRVFSIAFSQRKENQTKSTCYIRSSKARLIRKKMADVIHHHATSKPLLTILHELGVKVIERAIESNTRTIFPLSNVYVRKIKVLKKPKFDITKLMELHGDVGGDSQAPIIEESADAKNLLSAEVAAAERFMARSPNLKLHCGSYRHTSNITQIDIMNPPISPLKTIHESEARSICSFHLFLPARPPKTGPLPARESIPPQYHVHI